MREKRAAYAIHEKIPSLALIASWKGCVGSNGQSETRRCLEIRRKRLSFSGLVEEGLDDEKEEEMCIRGEVLNREEARKDGSEAAFIC